MVLTHVLSAAWLTVLSKLDLSSPSLVLYYMDVSVQPKDLLSDSNINLGNIPPARKLYKVHSLRCTVSLLAPLCLARNIHGDGAHGISPLTPSKSGNAALI